MWIDHLVLYHPIVLVSGSPVGPQPSREPDARHERLINVNMDNYPVPLLVAAASRSDDELLCPVDSSRKRGGL